VLVHDIGEEHDLDDWADVLEILNEYGYTVIAMDLPGHGSSDNDYSERSGAESLDLALRYAKERTGHTAAIIMAGRAIHLMRQLPVSSRDIRALVVLSPPDDASVEGEYPKLVFVGATDENARAAADRFLRESRGWTLVSSFGTSVQGHQLLQTPHGKTIIRQILAFLADYAVPPR
jgi:pimeloyl-ACP methyl ester carboxylesterase